MKRQSKRYRQARERAGGPGVRPLGEAIALLQELPPARFDETVEMVFFLGIDPKQTDQLVRGTVALPHGTGKKVRIAVFARGSGADEARAAGAEIVGHEDLIKKVSEGWTDFDTAVTTPDLMKEVGRLGKILGPRGLMPSPKTGTVTREIGKTVRELMAGRIEFRTDKGANVHVPIGKRSFAARALAENAEAIIEALLKAKPAGVKGSFVRKCVVSTTMGPGVGVDLRQYVTP
ncbi:MAG: 50S ribosomal protein L1 [bacterium]|nr:50S ribosomal protein L1 [bacterium]